MFYKLSMLIDRLPPDLIAKSFDPILLILAADLYHLVGQEAESDTHATLNTILLDHDVRLLLLQVLKRDNDRFT